MANELTWQIQSLLRNDLLSDSWASGSLTAGQSNQRLIRNVQEIGLTHEPLNLGDVVAPGVSIFSNLDDANFVEIGIDVGGVFYPFLKVLPKDVVGGATLNSGEQWMGRLATSAPYAKADIAPVKLFYIIYDT